MTNGTICEAVASGKRVDCVLTRTLDVLERAVTKNANITCSGLCDATPQIMRETNVSIQSVLRKKRLSTKFAINTHATYKLPVNDLRVTKILDLCH